MDESRIHGAVAPGGQPKRQENSAGAGSAPEAQERIDRWGEVHTVAWDDERKMWAGPVQGTGLDGQPLRAWWPREALRPWPDSLLAPSDAHEASGAATSGRPGAVRAPEGQGKSTIPADEIPF